MQEEIDPVNETETWVLTNLPTGTALLDGKWVYKIKRGPNGEITRYKSRWVVRGFQQRQGIDYHEMFASVAKPKSFQSQYCHCPQPRDWEAHKMYVQTTFSLGEA